MRPDLQISQLKTLIAIDQHGSFTAASVALGRSQSAISQQMSGLEDAVGYPLFETTGRTRRLTEAGRALLRHAHEIITLCNHAVQSAAHSHASGIVRIGAPLEVANAILPRILREFGRIRPLSRVVLRIERSRVLMNLLEEGRLDLAISTWRLGPGEGTLLKTLRVHWISSPDWSPPAKGPLPLILTDEPSMFRSIGLNALDLAGMPYYERLTTFNTAGTRLAIASGLGVTPRTLSAFGNDVKVLGPEDGLPPLPRVSYWLHQSPSRLGRQVEELRDMLMDHEKINRVDRYGGS